MPFLHVTLQTSRPATLALSVARVTRTGSLSSTVLRTAVFDMDTMNPDDLLGILKVAMAKFADEITLLLEICLKQVDNQRVYMWEIESWSIGSGWKPANSSYDDSATSTMFVKVAPRAPANMTHAGWQYCSNRGDEQDWSLA
ncbi:unnamed protein product [Peronospora destructor]|uniref:Uncharacterized protein n=1 Tax=Peronospora destructor TaxID=86335 RepID=A0AAV0VDA2_9STRA|nr:unnamed protein product [Peronospora destructor]